MKQKKKAREFQTLRLFATLAMLTLLLVLILKLMVGGPNTDDGVMRTPASSTSAPTSPINKK